MSLSLDPHPYATLITALAAVGVLIDSAEVVYARRNYAPEGIFSWEVLRSSRLLFVARGMGTVLHATLKYPNYVVLVGVQGVCALLLVTRLAGPVTPLLVSIILVVRLLANLRNPFGLDGSDQMHVVLFAGLTFYYLVPDPFAKSVALWFIGAQLLLSYLSAGFAKLISSD